jgi:hypothetical protein
MPGRPGHADPHPARPRSACSTRRKKSPANTVIKDCITFPGIIKKGGGNDKKKKNLKCNENFHLKSYSQK